MRILANWPRVLGCNVVEPGARTGWLGATEAFVDRFGTGGGETSTAQAIAARAVARPPDLGGCGTAVAQAELVASLGRILRVRSRQKVVRLMLLVPSDEDHEALAGCNDVSLLKGWIVQRPLVRRLRFLFFG
jgi:hypothetical protein